MTDPKNDHNDPVVQPHIDRYAHHDHELSESTAEAVSRTIIRLVPLAYGILLGGLIDSLVMGLVAGGILSAALDLSMRGQSLLRALARDLTARLCPLVAAIAHGLAVVSARAGVPRLGVLRRVSCGAGASASP
ncbi:MAG: hypothetical protein KDI82_07545 [Gammaproteobacteria bacterium]|nr:hypothetical protein [Gammaproteobacteria bacterium]